MSRDVNVEDISVIVPSYNHGKYVREAIYSVLNQSLPVSEVIVVDDASSDDSLQRIRSINDDRIRVIAVEQNQGGAEALNIGIARSKGSLIAICNSDVVWEPKKLEMQIAILRQHLDVGFVFTDVTWIGDAGQKIDAAFGEVFTQGNKTRFQWMRQLFEQGNCLCHPSILARREMYDGIPNYDNRLRQLPDYKMWLQMLQRSSLYVMNQKLLRYRIHDNTSKPSPATSARDRNEFADIALEFMEKLSEENFVNSFGSHLPSYDPNFNLTVEKIIYLWSVQSHIKSISAWVANNLAMRLLSSDAGSAAWQAYGLTVHDFHVLRGIESSWTGPHSTRATGPREAEVLRKIGAQHWISSANVEYAAIIQAPPIAHEALASSLPSSVLRLLALWRHPFNRAKRRAYRHRRV